MKSPRFISMIPIVILPFARFALAQVTGLSYINIERAGWNVSASSSQAGQPVVNVIDGSSASYWQSDATAGFPQNVTIDFGNTYLVNGLTYLPRSGTEANGKIGRHTIFVSTDGAAWTLVTIGTYANSPELKTSSFAPRAARFVRISALNEASGAGQSVSAAEINVLTTPKASLTRENWRVSADSAQPGPQSYLADDAIDGAVTSYWQTQSGSALPHYFTIDQSAARMVSGLTYLPRPPSTGRDGNIGRYRVERSSDGSAWTAVINGSWPDNNSLKTAEFPAVSARYFRLVALTEAGGRGQLTTASEINLLDGSSVLQQFRVTVDSQETASGNYSGTRVLDGTNSTFWISQTSGTAPGYPHYVTIDMQRSLSVSSLTYVPRQDANLGNIGSHVIHVSSDATNWIEVARGRFWDSQVPKLVNFQESNARYVRLTALSEAGNRGPWASASEILLGVDTGYSPPPATLGQWGQTIDFPTVPVAAALIGDTNKIVIWSAWQSQTFIFSNGLQTVTSIYDPSTGEVSNELITNTNHDMFCPGISLNFSGDIFVTGGNGAQRASAYSISAGAWTGAPDMQIARGYQSQVTLSDGRIWTLGGSWSGGIGGKIGEFYNFTTGLWTRLPGNPVGPIETADVEGAYRSDNHGWFFPWSNATVFHAGPSRAMNWYSTRNGGGVLSAGTRGSDADSMCGVAVMYDAVAGRILTAGGSPSYTNSPASRNAHRITLGRPNATAVVESLPGMNYRRAFHNSVVLPDGKVLVLGGQEFAVVFTDDQPVLHPELYDPETNAWRVLAPESTPRTYHSVALLLADGTVFSGGGGLCFDCSVNHMDAQIFRPPYLFNSDGTPATRPVITAISARSVPVGGSLTVTTAAAAARFALVRTSSVTHTVNTDQRRVPLVPTRVGTNMYRFTLPADPGVLLPGYWMLFALDSRGVPSVARYVLVTP